jgi:hypothetical protein
VFEWALGGRSAPSLVLRRQGCWLMRVNFGNFSECIILGAWADRRGSSASGKKLSLAWPVPASQLVAVIFVITRRLRRAPAVTQNEQNH